VESVRLRTQNGANVFLQPGDAGAARSVGRWRRDRFGERDVTNRTLEGALDRDVYGCACDGDSRLFIDDGHHDLAAVAEVQHFAAGSGRRIKKVHIPNGAPARAPECLDFEVRGRQGIEPCESCAIRHRFGYRPVATRDEHPHVARGAPGLPDLDHEDRCRRKRDRTGIDPILAAVIRETSHRRGTAVPRKD
jgi:hypothetical protein